MIIKIKNMRLKAMVPLVVILGVGLTMQLASAQGVVYLSSTNADPASISSGTEGAILSIKFTTGNNAGGYTLDSIALLLSTNSNAEGEFIYANLSRPSAGIVNHFEENSVPTDGGYVVFTPDSVGNDTSLLNANTTYNIYFNCGGESSVFYVGITTTAPISPNDWSYGGITGGLSGDPIFDIIATPVTAVPEPSSLALAGLAGFVACWFNYFSARRRVD